MRVLSLGAGAGLAPMLALRAGAHHVTAVERWLYLALTCKEALAANQARACVCGWLPGGSSAVLCRAACQAAHQPAVSIAHPLVPLVPQFPEERYRVVYKRPTDLKAPADVPVCCNLLLANVLDEGGFRGSGV